MDLYKPEYNILKTALAAQDAWGCFAAGSSLGLVVTEEMKLKKFKGST
jgi:hypothetical protein